MVMTILPIAVLVAAVMVAVEMALIVDLLMMVVVEDVPLVICRNMHSRGDSSHLGPAAVRAAQEEAAPGSGGGSCSDLYGGDNRHQPWAVVETLGAAALAPGITKADTLSRHDGVVVDSSNYFQETKLKGKAGEATGYKPEQ